MNLIYIYGPPGVGKMTVGKVLSKMTGYKLFHNQLSIEFVRAVFDFGKEPFNRLVIKYRSEIIEEAAKNDISIIFTSLYAKGYNEKAIKEIVKKVQKYDGHILFVQLYCDKKTLLKRVESKSREGFYKIRSARKLNRLLLKYDLVSSVPFIKSLTIDNTSLSPVQTARRILSYYHIKKVSQ